MPLPETLVRLLLLQMAVVVMEMLLLLLYLYGGDVPYVWLIWLKGNEAAGSSCCMSCCLPVQAVQLPLLLRRTGVRAGLLQNTVTVGLMPALIAAGLAFSLF